MECRLDIRIVFISRPRKSGPAIFGNSTSINGTNKRIP